MGRRSGADGAIIWYAAFYIRLSKETRKHDDSDSVINQKTILTQAFERLRERYPEETYVLTDIYVDDGETGTDFDRHEFQRLLADIEGRRLNMVMFKDLSRLGRNYTETGYYLDQFFVKYDTRYICLTNPYIDSYRTRDIANSPLIPIQNVFNDDFARTTSLKVRDVFQAKKEDGQFIGAFAPYGYAKNPMNKNAFIIDEEAAAVVRDIFTWFTEEGLSKRGIALKLSELGILNPAAYKRQKGYNYRNPASVKSKSGETEHWSPRTVYNILRNETYIGNMVQGRQRVKSYKVHDRVLMPESAWTVVEGVHEPIVGKEIFEKAQSLHQRDTRTADGKREVHMLAGFVRCADCKKSMRKTKGKNGTVYYLCRSYYDKKLCSKRTINAGKLEDAILASIQAQAALAGSIDAIVNKINNAPVVSGKSARMARLLQTQRQELQLYRNMKTELYVDLKKGLIGQDEYIALRDRFEKQEAKLTDAVGHLEAEMSAMTGDIGHEDHNLASFMERNGIKILTRSLIADLISNVFINRDCSVIIEFKFADCVCV